MNSADSSTPEPDYTTCSLDELLDVERRIDRERFPERLARLQAEIRRRSPGPIAECSPSRIEPLPVLATIREALCEVASKWRPLAKALLAPAVALAWLDLSEARLGEVHWVTILLWPLAVCASVMYGVSCHRVVLLGEESLSNSWGLCFTRREFRFAGWWVLLLVLTVTLLLPFLPVVGVLAKQFPEMIDGRGFQLLFVLTTLPASYVVSRLSLVLPAAALDRRPTLGVVWASSQSNGWRLTFALLIPGIALCCLGWLWSGLVGNAEHAAAILAVSIWFCLLGAVELAVLSLAFRILSAPQPEDAA
jgi:hypothetical protein